MHDQEIKTYMINYFNECTLNKDYRNFYYEFEKAIKRSAEDFQRLYFSNSHRCNFIIQNFLLLFKFLRDYPFLESKRTYYTLETGDPDFVADMKTAIDSKNWDSFYWKYRSLADFIIDQAREQKVLSITIEWNYKFYPNFELIDNLKRIPRPSLSINSGEMLLNRPGPSPHLSATRQSLRNPSPNRSAESTPKRNDSHYRQARDKYSPSLINITSNGSSRSSSNVGSSPKYLNFVYGSSNSGILSCCRNSMLATRETEYNSSQSANFDPPVVTTQPAYIKDDYYSTNSVQHERNGDFLSDRFEDNQNLRFSIIENRSSNSPYQDSRTGYSVPPEISNPQQPVGVQFHHGLQSVYHQGFSPRPSDQVVEHDYSRDKLTRHVNSQMYPAFENENERRREQSDAGRDHVTNIESLRHQGIHFNAIVKPSVSPKIMDTNQFNSLPPAVDHSLERSHSQITSQNLKSVMAERKEALHDRYSEAYDQHAVPIQTSSNGATQPSYKVFPQLKEIFSQEVRDSSSKTEEPLHPTITSKEEREASCDTHSETYGGSSMKLQSVVPSRNSSNEAAQSSFRELSQPQEQLYIEAHDSCSGSEKQPQPTITSEAQSTALRNTDSETYGGFSMKLQSVVPRQSSGCESTELTYQELPFSKSPDQIPLQLVGSALTNNSGAETCALRETHPEPTGGIPLHPQAGVQNLTLNFESSQPNYGKLLPSEAQEQSLPESMDISLRSANWETPETTSLPQGFTMINNGADMETMKHDDSFEELESDTVRPDNEDQSKQSSEEFDDHRSSMSSIHIDFSPVEDSIISNQSCFNLDDMRRPIESPVESVDGKFNYELYKHQVEMSQVNRDVGKTENLITNKLEYMQREQTIRPNNSVSMEDEEEDNSDFKRKLEEIKRQQAEELRRIREERRRKQKLLDEELQKMRQESKERFRMFMTCIILKQRFEQQEDKWKDWIRDCRNNIAVLQKYYLIFEETYRRIFTGSKKKQPDSDDLEDFEKEKSSFSGYVMRTYNAMQEDFETLKNIEQHYNDAMFLRVLQKCIADVAQMLVEISAITFSLNSDLFSKLDEKMSKLAVDLIYSTTKLRSVCSKSEDWKYQNVQFPRIEPNHNIREVN